MSLTPQTYTARIHTEPGEELLWAEVAELPGVFATGRDMAELREALAEAMGLVLLPDDVPGDIQVTELPGQVTEQKLTVVRPSAA